MTAGRALALAAYPPWFRERYGDELAALAEDHGPSARATLAAVLITAAGSRLGWRAMRSSPAVRRLMTGPLVVLALVALGFIPIALVAVRAPSVQTAKQFPPWFAVSVLIWALLVAVTSIWWTIAVPRALRAAGPTLEDLRLPAVVATGVALLLLAPAGLLAAIAIATGTVSGLPATVVAAACTLVVSAAAATGLVSAGRGLSAVNTESA